MPKMKPRKDQGNIDKKALAKQNGEEKLAQDEFDRLWAAGGYRHLNEVDLGSIKNKNPNILNTDKWWDDMFDPNKMSDNARKWAASNEFGDVVKIDNMISSGGEGDPNVKANAEQDLRDQSSLYGTRRFNTLWSLYNKVKDTPGIESNPEYQRLIKKITRKMPKTLKNLEKNVQKSIDMRNKINLELGNKPLNLKNDEIVSKAKTRINKFIEDPYWKKPVRVDEDNADTNIIVKPQVSQNKDDKDDSVAGRRGPYLAPQLGTDIKKSLKNFR